VRRRAAAVGCRRRRAADVDDEEQWRKVPSSGSRIYIGVLTLGRGLLGDDDGVLLP
jgi:hypothetical protein